MLSDDKNQSRLYLGLYMYIHITYLRAITVDENGGHEFEEE